MSTQALRLVEGIQKYLNDAYDSLDPIDFKGHEAASTEFNMNMASAQTLLTFLRTELK